MLGHRLRTVSSAITGGLDTQTVTTGAIGSAIDQNRERGYTLSGYGSITDGTSDLYGGAVISAIYWYEGEGAPTYTLTIPGATNTGWDTVTIGSTTLYRTAASFVSGSWTWTTTHTVSQQAFGASSATRTVTFA